VSDSLLVNPLGRLPTDMLTSSGSRLEGKVRAVQNVAGNAQKRELKEVAQEFEALFIAQILKVMRETIEESGLTDSGPGKSIYTELFDQELALSLARRGALGISDLLYENLLEMVDSEGQGSGSNELRRTDSISPDTLRESSRDPECGISDLKLPVQGTLCSGFGFRLDPLTHQRKFHKGIDIAAPEGVKVVAALPGKVISAGFESGYGNTVLVQHAGDLQTRYGHLHEITVKAGDVLAAETQLGTVGSTGRSTGPHLHFEIMRMGHPVNPISILSSQVFGSE
jgi:murein DD-endopeptidase MepM/ murein hydrolase activator NlpD